MVAQFLVDGVELLARGRAHDAGDAEVGAFLARPHLDAAGVEVRRVLADDLHDGLRESRTLAPHHLDREIARKRKRRAARLSAFLLGHLQAETDSRLPVRITLCL